VRLFGREISFQSPIRAAAARPAPRPADHGAPWRGDPDAGGEDLWERGVASDPREAWWWLLPWKLTPQQVINILKQSLAGDVWQQANLLALMLDSWPTFRMAQHQLREAVAYTNYVFQPWVEEDGQSPDEESDAKAKLVARAWRSMDPDPFSDEKGASGTCYDFTDAALNGLAMSELLWDEELRRGPDGKQERLVRASAWVHPRHFTYTREGKVALYTDGKMFAASDLLQFETRQNPGGAPSPDKYVCSQFISKSGSVLGAGFARPLAYLWSGRQFGWEFMLQTAKKWGFPFLDITYQPGQSPAAERAKMKGFAREAGPDRFMVHPVGSEVKVQPAQSLGPDNPQRWVIDQADRECLFLLLGQEATTFNTPGKLGQEGTHADVKDERVQGLADWTAHNPMRQFARAVLRVNYGKDGAGKCPSPAADFTKPLDTAQVSQLASSIMMSRLPVRQDEFYRKLNFSIPQPKDIVVQDGNTYIFEKPVTESEQQRMRAEAQAYEQAVAMAQRGGRNGGGGGEEGPPEDVQAHEGLVRSAKLRHATSRRVPTTKAGLEALLRGCEKGTVDRLEALVVKAERSGTGNGEWTAVRRQLELMVAGQGRRTAIDME